MGRRMRTYKIFISYAHIDNELNAYVINSRFVSNLKENIQTQLTIRFGGRDKFKIWFDEEKLDGNAKITPEIKKEVESSDIFLCILTPGYKNSIWCNDELDTFIKSHSQSNNYSNIFAVEPIKIKNLDEKPRHIRGIETAGFSLLERYPKCDDKEYITFIDNITTKIHKYLLSLDNKQQTPKVINNSKKIFLAQVTDDLEKQRRTVQRYLEDFGYEIYPKYDYIQSAQEFKKSTDDDIKECSLFVQLLSLERGKRPIDLKEGYYKAQFDIAIEEKIPIIQWFDENLDEESITDEIHYQLVTSEFVRKSDIEEFNKMILKELKQIEIKNEQKEKKELKNPNNFSEVFINFKNEDKDIANKIKEKLKQSCIVTETSWSDTPPDVEELKENLIYCNYYLLVFGHSQKDWVEQQLRFFNRIRKKREESINSIVIYKAPPKGEKKVEGISFPFLKEIDAQDAHKIDEIEKIIRSCSYE